VSTAYDAASRPVTVGGNFGGVATSYLAVSASGGYSPHGGLALYQYGNNLWRQNSYNTRLQLNTVADQINNSPGSAFADQQL
jgi:hypothetical protein